jgi:hypothetical protein
MHKVQIITANAYYQLKIQKRVFKASTTQINIQNKVLNKFKLLTIPFFLKW